MMLLVEQQEERTTHKTSASKSLGLLLLWLMSLDEIQPQSTQWCTRVLARDDAQDKDDWRLKISGATG